MMLAVFLGSLFIALIIGIPIALGLIFSSIAMMFAMDMFDSQIIAQNLINGMNNFSLMAIPFFILAGELINRGGISHVIVNFAMAIVGHIRGGLGFVAIIASIIFAGISGSAIAEVAALGAILIPMMAASGYSKKHSTGLVAASGIIGTVIPPSIPLIILGVTSGIVPGILMALGLAIAWLLVSRKYQQELPPRKSTKEILLAFKDAIWALLLPVIILVGLRGGIFTPTEAGVVVAFYSFLVGLFVYRQLNIKTIYESLVSAAKTTSVVLFIIAASTVSAWLITVANVPRDAINLLEPFLENPILLMLVINILLLLVGMVMDIIPAILIFTPVLLPITTLAGIDPIYFGIILVINLSIGLITPPVGTVLYVAGGISNQGIIDVVKGIMPLLITHLIILILLTLFPQIITIPVELFG